MAVSTTSMPFGQALAAQAFDTLTPPGVVAIRQLVTALVLLPTTRPPLRRLTWAQWWPAMLLGCLFVAINLSLAPAIDRLGVALAITLELLGPLSVALLASRSRTDLACAIGAGAGVYLLVLPGGNSDFVGIAFGLAGATGWAGYILLNRLTGTRLPGVQGTAIASGVSTLLCLPILAWLLLNGLLTGRPLILAIAAGLLCSVVPYVTDLLALRRVPAGYFGLFMSINPVVAALAGLLLLDQTLAPHEIAGIVVVMLSNTLASIRLG
jgi:inner membrane transporter RhtA